MRKASRREIHGSISLVAIALVASCGGGVSAPGLGGGGAAGHARGGAGGSGGSVTGPGGAPGGGACQGPATDCTANAQCCSGRCEPVTGMAGVVQCTNACFADGVACAQALDCCSLGCFNGRCGGGLCKVASEACTQNADCCSNICQAGQCQVDLANRDCRPTGETCTSGSGRGCCTDVCDETVDPKRCKFGTETCRGEGAACTADAQCCRGICDPATHACKTPCTPAGGACTGNATCCSSSCTAGACGTPPTSCTPISGACTSNAQCCSGLCFGGFCEPGFIVG
jgi:hypothetical protein